jgi:hypothetical protein
MANQNSTPQDGLRRLLARVLGLVALILTASAGIVVFIAIPIDLAEKVHALPHWSIFLVLVFAIAPIIVAWSHAGIYILLIVTRRVSTSLRPVLMEFSEFFPVY